MAGSTVSDWPARVAAAVTERSEALAGTPLSARLALGETRATGPLDAFRRARHRFLTGERVDMGPLAAELGIDRATLFRWVGNRDQLVGDIVWSVHLPTWEAAVAGAKGTGAARVADVVSAWVSAVIGSAFFRAYVQREGDRALRLLTTRRGLHQLRVVACVEGLLVAEQQATGARFPLPAHQLAYVLTRVCEAFVYADLVIGEEPDVEHAAIVIASVLGIPPATSPPRRP